jgi:hypothetical protein
MTMKTMLRAAIMVFSIGISSAYADNGDGYAATTLFTSIPDQQSSRPATAPGRVTITIPNDAEARGYVTTSRGSTWLFLPTPDSGER